MNTTKRPYGVRKNSFDSRPAWQENPDLPTCTTRKEPFREHHLFQILSIYDAQPLPLDLLLRTYFKLHHSVGAKDRKFICDTLYTMIRWKDLFDHFVDKRFPLSPWRARYQLLQKINPLDYLKDENLPKHTRLSFPKDFFDLLTSSLGPEKAWEFCRVSNETAPTTVRVNLLKTTREALLNRWKNLYSVSPCKHSPTGILFHKKENFFGMPEFKEGLFEVQDEASQLIADLIEPSGKDKVLDFCAGSGGKTLAFAPKLREKGQIFVHDIRPRILQEAKKRLKRAGIQNAQILPHDSPTKARLKGMIDWVIVDAPCSGTGTLRRNPDMKYKFDPEIVERIVAEQRAIFEEALSFLTPKGKIVYSTCSVLPEENEKQLAYFQEKFNLKVVGSIVQTFPESGSMDGFFGVVLGYIPNVTQN